MSKTSNPKGVGAIKILCRQPGTSFNSIEISSRTGSSLPVFLLPCHSSQGDSPMKSRPPHCLPPDGPPALRTL